MLHRYEKRVDVEAQFRTIRREGVDYGDSKYGMPHDAYRTSNAKHTSSDAKHRISSVAMQHTLRFALFGG